MLAMERIQDQEMRDLEREFQESIDRRRNSEGDPLEGLFTLTRRMEAEEDHQLDVDITILDFLAYKASEVVFEWRSSSHPHESDLPTALVSMTAGMSHLHPKPPHRPTRLYHSIASMLYIHTVR